MQALFAFVQKLCALVMVALLADHLMPSGTMRKYARLVCGMLVLHIMVSQAFALIGRGAPDVAAQQWTQLMGEMSAQPDRAGREAALSAHQRQAQHMIANRARAAGMQEPAVSIAWRSSGEIAAVILREREPSIEAGARLTGGAQTPPPQADAQRVCGAVAEMLGLPVQAVLIQKEGEGAP